MRNAGFIFVMMFTFIVSSSGQTQYTSVPRTGEGRFDRSENTTFWPNPIFFKPSMFFSSSEANIRANRKWWRAEEQLFLKPDIAHGYLPDDIALESCLDLAFTGTANQCFSGKYLIDKPNLILGEIKSQSVSQYLSENRLESRYNPLQIGFPNIQNIINQKFPQNSQLKLGH